MEDPIPYPNPNTNPGFSDVDVSLFLDDDGSAAVNDAGEIPLSDDFFSGVDDFQFTFDDLSFADGLLLDPSEPQSEAPGSGLTQDRSPDCPRVLDCSSPVANQGAISSEESNFGGNSGVSRDSSSGNHSDRDVSSSSFVNPSDNYNCSNDDDDDNGNSSRENVDLDRKTKIKVEGQNAGNNRSEKCVSKRKKEEEQGESSGGEGRSSKSLKSTTTESENFGVGGDEDDKRKARLMRNRESAQLSRQRKKQYVEELEDKVRSMSSMITELNSKISYIVAENATLRQQLGGANGVCAPPPPPLPGMYPYAPMPYPWVPCAPYMVKPQGSQVPLVPIPRLKPQQPAPAPKVSKRSESKKGEGKTKKVASVSLLGILFFFLLFGGLVPMVNVRYGGIGDGFSGKEKGAVLMVNNHGGGFSHGRTIRQSNGTDGVGPGPGGNSSEPLVASLYVPRNDKLVKIDGNLIIHSVLASERAMASGTHDGAKATEETRLAIARFPPYPVPGSGRNNGRHPQLDGNLNGRQRALGSGSSDELRPAGSDGRLQQWFREGLAGPMLSSGMCTEVFQFDVSPGPGAIIPATSMNTTGDHQNSTRVSKPRNRRILHGHPIPLDAHAINVTEEGVSPHGPNDKLQSNKSHPSSMVVSVLVDPREAGDGDGEGVMGSKTLSRIFVVVLIDSVKYVTYSCMLPFVGSGSHLVTT